MRWNGRGLAQHRPAIYRIRVQGMVDTKWSDYLGGMAISTQTEEGHAPVTALSGQLLDQAALLGILNFLYNRGMPILLVEYLAKPTESNQ